MARPREFDAEEALDKAMALFWTKGYHDSSIRDLVEATGVNYYGLYSVFESKHGLFLAALDRYRDSITREIIRELKGSGSVEQRLERAFNRLIALMKSGKGRGCMICNTMVELAPHDSEAAAKVRAHRKLLGEAFAAVLSEDGRDESEVKELAEFLTTTAYSLGLLLRSGCSDATLQRHIRTALSVVT